MRKLATIQRIKDLQPIENANLIEKALILGWELVVKKGDFKINDLVVYIEIDSILPEKSEFEFLKPRKYRIKTIKLRGQISQGICFPLSILPNKRKYKEGDDVTDIIGVTKYLTPSEINEQKLTSQRANKLKKFMLRYKWFRRLFLTNNQKRSFPFWISKTDEERIQNIPHVIDQFQDYEVCITEKIDYQSVTFTGMFVYKYPLLKAISPKKYKLIVCSRNFIVNDKNSLYWRVAEKFNIENILKKYPDISIQGEQGDIGIQDNKYGLKEPYLWVFNIVNHKTGYFFNQKEIEDFCFQNNLTPVPFLYKGLLKDYAESINEIINKSNDYSVINPKILREGIVVRSVINGQKLLSFKVINPDFLLKYE